MNDFSDDDDSEYRVGYGRPPQETRFQKGQSGNPGGRPKGSKSWFTIIEEEFNRKVEVVGADGKPKKIRMKRLLTRQLFQKALTDPQYMSLAFKLMDKTDKTLLF